MEIKAGVEPVGNFSGTPKKATVAFGTVFPSTAYAITADAVTLGSAVYEVTIESKTVSGFTMNLGSDVVTDLTEVGWQAVESGG